MAKVALIKEHGGADKITFEDHELPAPGPGEVLIRHKAIGLNFIDIYHREGVYPLQMPSGLGTEAAGVIEAVGDGVDHLKVGDRAAYAFGVPGSYAEARVMAAKQVCALPDGITFEQGAAMMLKGLTCQYLFERTTDLGRGDSVLFHAAAGGVGLFACQWARSEGIQLIGTAGSADKCQIALDHGAHSCINYKEEDFVERVKALTNERGVTAVMDGVGADTFEGSLACLQPLGMLMCFGNASGPIPPFQIGRLGPMGSLKITRPTLFTHLATRNATQEMADRLFEKVLSGDVKINIAQTFALEDAELAHRALEARQTTGQTILTV